MSGFGSSTTSERTSFNQRSVESIIEHVALNAALAASTQLAAHVKPGNIHRYHDFKETKMEHYLSSAVALHTPMAEIAKRGVMVQRGLIDQDEVDMGWIIAEAVKDGVKWHSGGLTNLGILFLFAPVAAASGYILSENAADRIDTIDVKQIPKLAYKFVENTTPEDTINIFSTLYKVQSEIYPMSSAVGISLPESINELLEEEVNLLDFYNLHKQKNLIFQEISSFYEISSKAGLSAFNEAITEGSSMVDAITHTYISLLSLNPDSIILRNNGMEMAVRIMNMAKQVIQHGGYLSKEGRELTNELELFTRKHETTINPGVTADLTANVTFFATLSGIRP